MRDGIGRSRAHAAGGGARAAAAGAGSGVGRIVRARSRASRAQRGTAVGGDGARRRRRQRAARTEGDAARRCHRRAGAHRPRGRCATAAGDRAPRSAQRRPRDVLRGLRACRRHAALPWKRRAARLRAHTARNRTMVGPPSRASRVGNTIEVAMRPANAVVAVVDDEENIRETVGFALRREGYPVELFAHGGEAWQSFGQKLPGLVILDILMPEMDGLELCRKIRSISESIPIIFLTSRDEELDRVLGLEIGADDYLCKPFSMRELLARVKVLFRRAALDAPPKLADAEAPLRIGGLELDLQCYTVKWNGQPVSLTVTEFMMLHAPVRPPGHVKSRKQLQQDGYPHDAYVSERTIDSHIKRLRRKFEEVDATFDRIETVYGVGYRYAE